MRAPVFEQGLTAVLLLSACALQFNDPETDLRRKISEPYPVSFDALVGRWLADSTYVTDDVNARPLGGSGLVLDIFPDTTFAVADTGSIVFPAPGFGTFSLTGTSLFFRPDSSPALPSTATLTFLGNYLELFFPAGRRYVTFHRVDPPDTFQVANWLRDGRWLALARRTGSNLPLPESLRTNFESALFSGDSFHWESNRHGLITHRYGTFSATDSTLTLIGAGISTEWFPQWVDADTMRLWPLRSDRPDSGFTVFVRKPARHPFDLDVSFLTRYWRGDSAFRNGVWREFHYGDYFDMAPDTLHGISLLYTAAGLPRFTGWDIDSGRVLMTDSGIPTAFSASLTGNRMSMSRYTNVPSERLEFRFTAFDSVGLRSNPLARFPSLPYARMVVGTDTLAYYWKANFFRWATLPDHFEIFGVFAAESLSLIAQLPTGNLTFSSSMRNFRFGVSGRVGTLGRFTCFADSTIPFALRISSTADPAYWPGTFQGSCKVRAAENPATLASDSLLSLSGDFRFRLYGYPPLVSPLWNL